MLRVQIGPNPPRTPGGPVGCFTTTAALRHQHRTSGTYPVVEPLDPMVVPASVSPVPEEPSVPVELPPVPPLPDEDPPVPLDAVLSSVAVLVLVVLPAAPPVDEVSSKSPVLKAPLSPVPYAG